MRKFAQRFPGNNFDNKFNIGPFKHFCFPKKLKGYPYKFQPAKKQTPGRAETFKTEIEKEIQNLLKAKLYGKQFLETCATNIALHASCDYLFTVLPPPRATNFHAAENRKEVYFLQHENLLHAEVVILSTNNHNLQRIIYCTSSKKVVSVLLGLKSLNFSHEMVYTRRTLKTAWQAMKTKTNF